MLSLYAETLINNNLLELLSERGRNRVVKESLKHGLNYFHKMILPKKFTLQGQSMYGNIFAKKKNGKPALVLTGEFRDRILSSQTIRATFKKASIRYQFGRPTNSRTAGNLDAFRNKFTEDLKKTNPRVMESKSRNRIFGFMKGKKITFEKARKQILASTQKGLYRKTSYNAPIRKQMVAGISAINANDRKEIIDQMQSFVLSNWQKLGKANVRMKK